MRRWTEADIAMLKALLAEGGHTHSAMGEILGRTESAVRTRCYMLGLTNDPAWSDDEVATLREWYKARENKPLELDKLEKLLGRGNLSRKARELGLSRKSRPTGRKDRRKFKGDKRAFRSHRSRSTKRWIAENGHPRGMAGKNHTEDAKRRISETQKNQVALGMHHSQHIEVSQETRDRISRSAVLRVRNAKNPYSRVKDGRRKDLDNRYFRSRWEANYARFLRFLKEQGEIAAWEFEPDTFWFENIKRGVRSYTPDFKITEPDGTVYYVEVKGWMDAKSKTKLKRMKKYHPDVDLRLVREKEYRIIERQVGAGLPGWE